MTTGVATDRELQAIAAGRLRSGLPTDAIDGVTPQWIVEPSSAEQAAAVLQWCTQHRQPVVVRGGGTHLGWGRPPETVGVVLNMRALDRVLRYEPGDLTVSVEAGCPIVRLNQELANHGQWLPLDVADDAATVGGAIATNDHGALRHRYGTPRDLLIGVRLATADGRLASAGGQVVKNVAGYDLGRMVAGSFGSLAAIVSATFKLAPVPVETVTVAASFADAASLASAAERVATSQLDPMSLEAEAAFAAAARYRLFVRFGGTPAANADQAAAARDLIRGDASAGSELLTGDGEAALWRDWAAGRRTDTAGVILRVNWLPARLVDVVTILERIHRDAGVPIELAARAAVGSGTIRVDGDAASLAGVVDELRRAETVGHVVILHAAIDVKARADVWGASGSALVIARALKHALDPAGILNAARGPI